MGKISLASYVFINCKIPEADYRHSEQQILEPVRWLQSKQGAPPQSLWGRVTEQRIKNSYTDHFSVLKNLTKSSTLSLQPTGSSSTSEYLSNGLIKKSAIQRPLQELPHFPFCEENRLSLHDTVKWMFSKFGFSEIHPQFLTFCKFLLSGHLSSWVVHLR